jgi:hypothetical protein
MHVSTAKLHLLLALVSALTLTRWGLGTALLVLVLLALRTWIRHAELSGSAAGAGVLAPAQHAELLDPAGGHREAVAGPGGAVVQAG